LVKNKIYWLPLFAIFALVLFVRFSNAEIINNNDASKNETNVYKNMNVTFSNSWTTINSTLDSFIFSINQGNGFVNSTPIQINQSTNASKYSLLITADPGTIIYWRFFANDSDNNLANSGLQDFTISQSQYPLYITNSIGTNETIYTNKSIEFRSSWIDDKKLGSYIFSINQGNGFVNSTPVEFISNGDYTNISINKTYINSLSGTTIYWRFFANDSDNNWNSTPIQSYTINSSINTSSTNTSANQTIVIYESQSFTFDLINPGVEAVFQTDKSKNLDINKILVSVYSPMNNITLSVQRIQELPNSIKNPEGTTILSNYIIQQEGIPNEKLKSIKIDFYVPKSFLSDNNVSYSAVNLYRYYNDKWMIIPANKIGEDKSRIEFLATSAGTSYFLIGIEKPLKNELIQDTVNNDNVTDTSTPYDIPYSKKSNTTPWIIAILITIVAVISGYILMKKRNKKK
jgi:PGF-pre-PGF domain-containing protein